MLCGPCRASLPAVPRVRWPQPTPPGLVTPWSMADYDGAVRAMVVGHKDRGQFTFRRVLAGLLVASVRAAVAPYDEPVVLVPVPSRPGSSRRRGYDPMGTLVRLAVARLRAESYDATAAPLLVSSRRVVDQAGLSASERASNLAGSMSCPSPGLASTGPATRPGPGGDLRRRAHHRRDGRGGPASPRRRGPEPGRDRDDCGHAAPHSGPNGGSPFVPGPKGLASVHGVRPGPWLRHPDRCACAPSREASRCQSQAKRPT